MTAEQVALEAEERRRADALIVDRLEKVEGRVAEQVLVTSKLSKEVRMLRKRAKRDVAGLTEELAKVNRRLTALAIAAMLYTFGAVPEVRAFAIEAIKRWVIGG